jgi:hypothetical protein
MGAGVHQPPAQLNGFVGRDAAGHTEDDALAGDR